MTVDSTSYDRRWTRLGVALHGHLGRRATLLAALERLTWVPAAHPDPRWPAGPPTGLIVRALTAGPGGGPLRTAVTPIGDGDLLVGVEDRHGVRHYVLEHGWEATWILTEHPQQPALPLAG